MKRTVVFASVLLLAPWASGQNTFPTVHSTADSQAQTTFSITVVPGPSACPAVIHARHEPGLHVQRYVNGASKPEAPGMKIVLTLTSGRAQITHASIIVHGLNGKSHMVQTDTLHSGDADVTRAYALSFTRDDDNSVSTHIDLPGFTSVSSIAVLSVTYADGATWKQTEGRACQVAPDPFMLVAAQAAR